MNIYCIPGIDICDAKIFKMSKESLHSYYSEFKLTTGQNDAVMALDSFLNSTYQVFDLKGYAGTGKTTLIKGLVSYLRKNNRQFSVMAPTGRAAKVLRDKTGLGKTIHSSIYNLSTIESINSDAKEEADHSVRYYFPIRSNESDRQVIIVDEASMISSKKSESELFDFGTNVLLDDLLTYTFSNNSKNQLILIGDPAQLPPVTDSTSLALDIDYLNAAGYQCLDAELSEVVRQMNNTILENATTLREVLKQTKRNELQFKFDEHSFISLDARDSIDTYLQLYPNPEIGDGIIISYSNAQCFHYNKAIRSKLYPNSQELIPGDLVLINNNNYHTYGTELFNGDIAKVVRVSPDVQTQSAPVWAHVHGKKVRKTIHLHFRKISIHVPNYDAVIECYIIDSLLNSVNRDLSVDEMKALYVNFVVRFREEEQKRSERGLKPHKVGSEEFKLSLRSDPFYNALRVKYGYAITCHKAQGGEWEQVIVDYYGRVGLKDDHLRWCYTATTRAIKTLYAINPPNISSIGKLTFSPITVVNKIPNNALYLEHINCSPFHSDKQHRAKSLKYWDLKEKLEQTDFEIVQVESKGDFLERYTFRSTDGKEVLLQASHTGSGHFLDQFKLISEASEGLEKLQELCNTTPAMAINPEYVPSNSALNNLFNKVQQACSELDIAITNVVEEVSSFYVLYFFVTDSICSFIQFYFNKNFILSRGLPKTVKEPNDEKLELLIKKLENHAS